MFGFGKSKPGKDTQHEEEIEQLKLSVRKFLEHMKNASPESAAQTSDQMKNFCQSQKLLPLAFKTEALKRMRQLECEANMRVADKLIHAAAGLVHKEQLKERGQKLAESRRYFSKVCSLGAEPEWKRAYQRLAENVMMSGGISLEGVSRAKPKDFAPKNPNRAKT